MANVSVQRLVLGTAALGLAYGLPDAAGRRGAAAEEAGAVLAAAASAGIGAIDTAPAYGTAEDLVGMHAASGPAVWTKLGAGDAAGSWTASLTRLRRTRIDLLQWHNWTAAVAHSDDFRRTWDAAHQAPEIMALGATTYGIEDALAAVASGCFAVVQVEFNLLNQAVVAAVAPHARAAGVRVAVRSVWLQGVLTARGDSPALAPDLRAARAAAITRAEHLGSDLPALALRAALDHPGIDHVLIGSGSRAELASALVAAEAAPLAARDHAELIDLHVGGSLCDPRTWPNR